MQEKTETFPRGISLEEAWNRIGIKRTKLYQILGAGEIESYHVGSRHLIVEESLNSWIDGKRSTPLKK